MEIVQKKLFTKYVFTFKDESLRVSGKDKYGKVEKELNYSDFDKTIRPLHRKDERLHAYGTGFLLVGAFQIGSAFYFDTNVSITAYVLFSLSLICYILAQYSKTIYSTFNIPRTQSTERETVHIMPDENHDLIIDEIQNRRKKQLLEWYGEINQEKDLGNEILRFRKFHSEGIITQEELDKKIAQVELIQQERENQHAENAN